MNDASAVRPMPMLRAPLDLLLEAPADRPLVLLHSGQAGGSGRWNRWSIVARPERWFVVDAPAADDPGSEDPLCRVDELLASTRRPASTDPDDGIPFHGGWIGYFSYDLGRVIEPAVGAVLGSGRGAVDDRRWPMIALARCPRALVYDHANGTWYDVGDPAGALPVNGDRAVSSDPDMGTVGAWSSSLSPDDYLAAVERTLEYIAAGDIFQASIAQRLSAHFHGSTRHLARRALAESSAWYGAYLELPDARCALSMSPELFLELDASTRGVVTRPIKGTRPGHLDPAALLDSAKDAAELHMIVDLMRNDLGRVAEFGSVRVRAPRTIETHPTVHHGVAEVAATLRDGVSLGAVLRATFPGGSVTGAPKIRAMQIIDELEPIRRGPYCGAFGAISDRGDASLNIAIRTMLLAGEREAGRFDRMDGVIDYSVGSGIVADSDPLSEYRECLDKAAVLRLATEARDTSSTPPLARAAGRR